GPPPPWAWSAWRPRCPWCRRPWSTPACWTGPASPSGCPSRPPGSGGPPATAVPSRLVSPPTSPSSTRHTVDPWTPRASPRAAATPPTRAASCRAVSPTPGSGARPPSSTGSSRDTCTPAGRREGIGGSDRLGRPHRLGGRPRPLRRLRLLADARGLEVARHAAGRPARAADRAGRPRPRPADDERPLPRLHHRRPVARPHRGPRSGHPQPGGAHAHRRGSGRRPPRGRRLLRPGRRPARRPPRQGHRRQGPHRGRPARGDLGPRPTAHRLRLPLRPRGRAHRVGRRPQPHDLHHARRTMTTSTRGTARVPAVLVLEDGRVFRGRAYGAVGETFGEAVFSTGMTGYQETLTDPSYHRQVVVMTAPHVGITGVNTRALTRHLRERGAMRVGIFSGDAVREDAALLAQVREVPAMEGADLAGEVATTEPYVVPAEGEKKFTVAAIDLGIKGMTAQRMTQRGIEVHILPPTATVDAVYAGEPDAVFFSNGPGDPATADHAVAVMRGVLERGTPLFGICFGNQILGRALGFGTYKLKYGHRGINQPVQDRATGKVEVTSHNHGFAVDAPLDTV